MAFIVRILKSLITFGFGLRVPTSIAHWWREDREVPIDPRPPRVNDEEVRHAEADLGHLVVVRVIHERPVLAERELVLVGSANEFFELIEDRLKLMVVALLGNSAGQNR